jgi:hypothetical protein
MSSRLVVQRVGCVQARQCVHNDGNAETRRAMWQFVHELFEAATLYVFHHQVGLLAMKACVANGHDICMVQTTGDSGLIKKIFGRLRVLAQIVA